MNYRHSQALIKRHFKKPPQKQKKAGLSGIIRKNNFAVAFAVFALVTQLFFPALPKAMAVVEPAPNPELGQACGLDIALVMDSSGSIDSTELSQMKSAFGDFVDALLPATPTLFSVTHFGNTATVLQTFTSDLSLIDTAINSPASSGSTNWQDALAKAHGTFDPRSGSNHPNLIVFSSDGEPNKYGADHGPGAGFDDFSFEQAVTQANTIKNSGTRIITLGIGLTGNGTDHLKAISSDDAYYNVADFGALAASLEQLATDLCGGTITVTKIIDADGDLNTTEDQAPGAGWSFTIAGNADTTDDDGKSAAWEVDPGTYEVTETISQNHSLIGASCSGATDNGSLSGNTISGIEISEQDIVSCIFYNQETEEEPGTLIVKKEIVSGDADYEDFSFSINGEDPINFEEDGENEFSVEAGLYTVVETADEDYSTVYSNCENVLVEAGETKTCTITNRLIPQGPDATFHFIKQICPSYGDVEGNKDADKIDATGGHYSEFSNADGGFGSSTVLPVHPDEIDEDCAGAREWYFNVDDNSGMGSATTLGPTDGDGQLSVPFSSLPENAKTALSSGRQMWVEEVQQDGYGFAALRCYRDALNGDNLEYITLGENTDNWPSDVYCIAYNVEEETPDICEETELLANRGFEFPTGSNSWDIYPNGTSGLGWGVTWTELVGVLYNNVGRPDPANLELHRGVFGWLPSEGDQYTELDSDWDGFGGDLVGEPANVIISQEVPTVLGGEYHLTFDHSPRPGVTVNKTEIYWNGTLVDTVSADGTSKNNTDWTSYSYSLTGADGTSVLEFKEIDIANSYGSFLDNVSLKRVCEEEPQEYADLRLIKSADPESVQSGEQSVFTITVVNGGADAAVNVVVNDLLPVGASFVSSTSTKGSYNDGTGEWNIGSLASGESATLEITVTITGEIKDEIVNAAIVTSDTPDPDSGNNEDSALVYIVGPEVCEEFTLTVTKTGEGNGTVTGQEGEGQEETYCDTDECREENEKTAFERTYCADTVVTLTANPDENSNFDGSWSGDCSGTNPVCQVTMDGDKSVNAHFALNSSGGGSSVTTFGGSSSGGSGIPTPPGGQVNGTTTPASSLQMPAPQILGETTELPRTGQSVALMLLIFASFAAVLDRKFKLVN
ncbi:MAG: hypothetical protein COT92_03800 [Candidatus Doudnabacteria bacterium CG10_big_fil_rev_8_21_14_0_10_42_18]|uniref:VWFA domain-containing protein n=1 Tax=Candidatus Doudnabacteria bacterium CG10_big_fil_rev_8_21_14_0_10_42_18 TaxID=1974552 RepID=A0A2H0VCC5_9BACT|nr:MAG: hypothetical protein COT92_03800 [Candidatus Doudnabacteria bacterium CG10_big_fil_rev_8_21_14_0_10_42_18]